MFRIADAVAKVRMLYPSPTIGAPSVLVIDVPPANRGSGLALDRYYPIIIETDQESAELERFFTKPRVALRRPDLLDHRRSNIHTGNILIWRYDPPIAGWPWIVLARWPDVMTATAPLGADEMARGCYSFELFEHLDEADAHCVTLLEQLGSAHGVSVRLLSAGTIATPGNA